MFFLSFDFIHNKTLRKPLLPLPIISSGYCKYESFSLLDRHSDRKNTSLIMSREFTHNFYVSMRMHATARHYGVYKTCTILA